MEMNTNSALKNEDLLQVQHLKKYFNVKSGMFAEKKQLCAVNDVSFSVKSGETLGLVGESGCGKSTTGNCVIRLLEAEEGSIIFNGQDITHLPESKLQSTRKDIQMIFQDPYSSLNPRMRVLDLIAEPFRFNTDLSKAEIQSEVFRLLDVVGLSTDYIGRFPHEFSGGQRQRICIARALSINPKLIICDEPISALDVSMQAQIMNLLMDLQQKFCLTYIFISHALPSVKHISTNVAVMYLGHIVELARTADLFRRPVHPYTEGLLSAVPIPDPEYRKGGGRVILGGDLPSPVSPPSGCPFHPRCRYATEKCKTEIPETTQVEPGHFVTCHHPIA